jgi:hypothetical protein
VIFRFCQLIQSPPKYAIQSDDKQTHYFDAQRDARPVADLGGLSAAKQFQAITEASSEMQSQLPRSIQPFLSTGQKLAKAEHMRVS